MTESDIERYRDDTPGVKEVIHFNNAGSALMPKLVYEAVETYQHHEYLYGGYRTAARYEEGFQHTRQALAQLISAKPEEIALLESATTAWYKAFLGLNLGKGDVVLTSKTEYVSNFLGFLREKKWQGIEIQVIPHTASGEIDVDAMADMLSPRVKVIAISHIPTNGGLVNPAAEIGKIAKKHGIPYLLDACQTIGQIPTDVDEIGCDMLSATGRKFLRGPRGTGFLYVRESLIPNLDPPMPDLTSFFWEDEHTYRPRPGAMKFENFEKNFAGHIGLGIAAQYALDIGMESIWSRVLNLSAYLRNKLNEIPGVRTRDLGENPCGIVTFTSETHSIPDIISACNERQINVSMVMPEGALLDMRERGINTMVRASVHYYNTESEIDTFIEVLNSYLNS